MNDTYMFATPAPIGLAWVLALVTLRVGRPRRLAMAVLASLAVALVVIGAGRAAMIERIEGARGQDYFNEAWVANAKAHSMKVVYLMLGLGALPAVLALIGLVRKRSGPLLGRLEPAWLANGSLRTRRTFYRFFFAALLCLIVGATVLAGEWINQP